MDILETMEYLESLSAFGMKLGLERLKWLLAVMGDPQRQLSFVHVAGTNGKGSITMMTAKILERAGCRTGIFISPHVLCYRECMQIDGEMIGEQELADCASRVRNAAEECETAFGESPTQFEVELAIAFLWFWERRCDIVCLEVGLGGRMDGTNVIDTPLVSVIASIGLDHTAILGDTVEKIAAEKAGIIKGGTVVLYPIQEPAVEAVVKRKCEVTGAKLVQPDLRMLKVPECGEGDREFSYGGLALKKSLQGGFQIYNAVTAVETARSLQEKGFPIRDEDIMWGIGHTWFPARVEVLSENPLVLLDGAHNPPAAAALARVLKSLPQKNITIMMGILKDKDYEKVLRHMIPYADRFLAVSPPGTRALSAGSLAKEAKKLTDNVASFHDLEEAVEAAFRGIGREEGLVVCGSLYLAAQVRPLLLREIEKMEGAGEPGRHEGKGI